MKEIVKMFEKNSVRCFEKNGEPYFSVLDVCKVLGIANSRDATGTLEKDDVCLTDVIDKLGRQQALTIINEGALYQLIFKSRKESAKTFRRWVTHEIIPSIRKTGKYSIPQSIKQISTKNRTALTSEWQEHGITKPHEFIQLTLQEYKALDIKNKKNQMTKREIALLSALESMEMLKLFDNQNVNGYYECKDSLVETAGNISLITKKKEVLK